MVNAMLRYYFHLDPDTLTDEQWQARWEELQWIREIEAENDSMNVREVIFDIIGRDRLSPTLDKIGVRGESARKVMSSLNRQTLTFNDNIKTVAAEIPGLSRGFELLRNPVVLAGAALTGATVALSRAADQAARFNHEFRNLANLNLDKTRSELQQLKDLVTSTAYAGGFDLSKTNSAFYDVQSVTGLSGAAASPMVRKGMEFARLLGADLTHGCRGWRLAQAQLRILEPCDRRFPIQSLRDAQSR